jgi:hypothetical protein
VAAQRSKRKGFADPAHPFVHQGSADLNTYKMFLELSHALMRPQGRMGMIVPSGIYTDKGTTNLRELFLDHCDWQWLFGFENREGIFDIHRVFKFCPLIVQKGGTTQAIRAAFMHRNVDDWAFAERHVLAYPRERVLEFSPYSKAILEIRDKTQAIQLSDIQGVALPLLEGNIIDQFQASSKGWVSGKGRSAVWREISADEDVFEPQYLIGLEDAASKVFKTGEFAGMPKWRPVPKVTFIDVTSATNARTARVACTPYFPCGNTAAILRTPKSVFALATVMNTIMVPRFETVV